MKMSCSTCKHIDSDAFEEPCSNCGCRDLPNEEGIEIMWEKKEITQFFKKPCNVCKYKLLKISDWPCEDCKHSEQGMLEDHFQEETVPKKEELLDICINCKLVSICKFANDHAWVKVARDKQVSSMTDVFEYRLVCKMRQVK